MAQVSVGPTTVAGYGATIVGLIGAVLALVFPDMPEQELAVVASSAFTVVAFVVTQVGRYAQAKEHIRAEAQKALAAPRSSTAELRGLSNIAGTTPAVDEADIVFGPMFDVSRGAAPSDGKASAPPVPPAPFDPDGEPRDGDLMAVAPEESFIADPKDKDGVDDRHIVRIGADGHPVVA